MIRLNMVLLLVLVVLALALVTSQHQARRSFQLLEAEQERGRELEVEHNLLELELSTLATPARIEKLAGEKLKMKVPRDFVRGADSRGSAVAESAGVAGRPQ